MLLSVRYMLHETCPQMGSAEGLLGSHDQAAGSLISMQTLYNDSMSVSSQLDTCSLVTCDCTCFQDCDQLGPDRRVVTLYRS